MSVLYKYPVLFVKTTENDEKCLYKYEHAVTGIDENAPLGYYDEINKNVVAINTDKNIFEYNWAEVIQRIIRNNNGYLDKFESTKNVIIVHEDVTYNRPAEIQNYTAIDMTTGERVEKERWVQFVNPAMYEFIKAENTLPIEKSEKIKKIEKKNHKRLLRLTNNEEKPHVSFPEAVTQLAKDKKSSLEKFLFRIENLIPLSIIMVFAILGYNGIRNMSAETEVKKFKDNMVVTTSVATTSLADSNQADIEADQMAVLNAVVTAGDTTGIVMIDMQRLYVDSLLSVKEKADSLDAYLRTNKKVSVILTAEIEDGLTTRSVNASAVVDSIRENELSILTNTINSMATKMAEERRADYDSLTKRNVPLHFNNDLAIR